MGEKVITARSPLEDPARPLRTLVNVLGLSPEKLQIGEGLEELLFFERQLPTVEALKLSPSHVRELIDWYGDAFTCRFLLGDRPVMTLEGFSASSLEDFKHDVAGSSYLTLDLKLNKARCLERWGVSTTNTLVKLFLFPEALSRALSGSLLELEEGLLHESQGDCKVVLLVPSHEIALNGEYLAIVGGNAMRRWEKYVPSVPPNHASVEHIRSEATKNLKWIHFALNHLTPLQLRVAWESPGQDGGEEPPISQVNDPIASLLYAHLFACCLLYTADQTVKLTVDEQDNRSQNDGPVWQCTYAAEKYVAVLKVGNTGAVSTLLQASTHQDAWAAIQSMAEYTVWAYSGERGAADRLGVLQGVIAHDFHSREIAIDGRAMLQHAVALKQRIEWGWKVFIEGRLDTYFSQVREAEQTVDAAIKGYNEQVQLLTKTLIDNMLAAVGIVVVSFIAAVFKDPFNPHIFQVGTILYAIYLCVFPMFFGLLSTWQRYQDSQRAFETRKKSLSKRLSVDEVETTVGAFVRERETWFRRWFKAVMATYIIIFLLLVLAIWCVPNYIAAWEDDFKVSKAEFGVADSKIAQVSIYGSGFKKDKEIVVKVGNANFTNVNSPSLVVHGTTVLVLTAQQKDLEVNGTDIQVRQGKASSVSLRLEGPSPIPEPNVEKGESIFEGESKNITLHGSNFDSIARVTYQDQQLNYKTSEDGKIVELSISKQMTKNSGEREIRFILNNGSFISFKLRVESVTYWEFLLDPY